jgi:nucleolar protein 12
VQDAQDVEEEDAVLSEVEVDSDASLEMPSSDEEDEAEDGLEEAYAAKLVAQRLKAEAEGLKNKKRKAEEELNEDEEEEDDDSEDDGPLDINDLVNGALGGKAAKVEKKSKKEKVVDPKKAEKAKKRAEETPDARDARTIFIGNVPSDCSTSNVSSLDYAI